jgi:hypothetical protein
MGQNKGKNYSIIPFSKLQPSLGCAVAYFAERKVALLTSAYVFVKTVALLQRRIGLAPVHDFNARIVPLLEIVWADAEWHGRAAQEIMEAFTFDRHFVDNGFKIADFHHRDMG